MLSQCLLAVVLLFFNVCRSSPLAHGVSASQEVLSDQHLQVFTTNRGHKLERTFNIDFEEDQFGYSTPQAFRIVEDIDNGTGGQVKGTLLFGRGDVNQAHRVIVYVSVSANRSSDLDSLRLYTSDTKYEKELMINSATDDKTIEGDLNVVVAVFVRPSYFIFGHTDFWTANIDIKIQPDVRYETYHMRLDTIRGAILGSDPLSFVAHNMLVSNNEGAVQGNWSLPSSIAFHGNSSNVDVDLIPKRWGSGPFTLGDLRVSSGSGNITIRMPFEQNTLSLRNATTLIETGSGHVNVKLVHGAVTDIRSATGSINATLLPHWAFYDFQGVQHDVINTVSDNGNTTLEVLPPAIDNYYQTNPLWFARSNHTTYNGNLTLTYPREWGGKAHGHIAQSSAFLAGDYELVSENRTDILVERWPTRGSDLQYWITNGRADVTLS